MFKSNNAADEISKSMVNNLISTSVEKQHKFNKLAKAIDYLNKAADLFDGAGLQNESDEIVKIIKDIK